MILCLKSTPFSLRVIHGLCANGHTPEFQSVNGEIELVARRVEMIRNIMLVSIVIDSELC